MRERKRGRRERTKIEDGEGKREGERGLCAELSQHVVSCFVAAFTIVLCQRGANSTEHSTVFHLDQVDGVFTV